MSPVTASEVLAVLNNHYRLLITTWEYDHIKPFTLKDVESFLVGDPGYEIDQGYGIISTRSHQVNQAFSAIGAFLVDKNLADAETVRVYSELWKIEIKSRCPYCKKWYSYILLMGRQQSCGRMKCQRAEMM